MGALIGLGIVVAALLLMAFAKLFEIFSAATPVINSAIVAFVAFALCKWKFELKTAWCVVIAAAIGYGLFQLQTFKVFFWVFAVLFTLGYGFLFYTIVYLFEAPEEYRIIAPGVAMILSIIGHKSWYYYMGMHIKTESTPVTDLIIDIDTDNTSQ